MKIVQLVTRNCTGGVQVVASSLDAGFRCAGNDASLWYFCDTDEQLSVEAHAKFIFRERASRLYYPRLLWRLFWQLRRDKPDMVLAHTTNTAVPGLMLAALAGIKKRVAVQHNPLDTYSSAARKADQLCANRGIYSRNIAVAETVRKTMMGYAANATTRVRLIHNGMKMPSRLVEIPAIDRETLREQFSLPVDRPLIVTIGRLAEQKNQTMLIEMMKSLEGVTLAIAGDGPLRNRLQDQIPESGAFRNIYMLGSLSAMQVRQLLQACDVFVTPSHFEAMPMVVLEAMQEGTVILASDIDAHRELIGPAGILAVATPQRFRDEIMNLLEHADVCAELSAKAVLRAELFSEEAMINSYLELAAEGEEE